MKFSQASLVALLLPAASARFIEDNESNRVGLYTEWAKEVDEASTKYHIELAPEDTRWVTEDEKWELRRVSHFILLYGISLHLLCGELLHRGTLWFPYFFQQQLHSYPCAAMAVPDQGC
jgi:hypothetical protein